MEQKPNIARLYSAVEPSLSAKSRFEKFVQEKYGQDTQFEWVEDSSIQDGFKLEYGNEVYDWTKEGRFEQFREKLQGLQRVAVEEKKDIMPIFRQSVDDFSVQAIAEEEGIVLSVGDGIVRCSALAQVQYGEILVFESGVRGMVQDLKDDTVGVILFGDDTDVEEGSRVRRTKKTAGVPVGNGYLGRVVDALGNPIDGGPAIQAQGYRAIESPAPGIVDRQSVNTPMNTGILSIDSMFPIGRGQRELIIGDRQTGKTSIAIDTILNQKGNGVICIYVAIGQKASSVAQLVENLKKQGAMDYTIVVNASASATAPIQSIAPYSGTAIGEYFMHQGKDVLIVYVALSKHTIA